MYARMKHGLYRNIQVYVRTYVRTYCMIQILMLNFFCQIRIVRILMSKSQKIGLAMHTKQLLE